jgi:hypothetical protein
MAEMADWTRDDELVRQLLSPFERVEPALLDRTRRRRRGRVALPAFGAAAASAALAATALAVTGVFGPLHGASLQPSVPNLALRSGVACQLIGGTAAHAQTTLAQNGYQVEWRFQRWGADLLSPGAGSTPGAVGGGYSSAPESVPPDSVVWDITPDTRTSGSVFVFVEAPNDPNAPHIVPPDCANGQP